MSDDHTPLTDAPARKSLGQHFLFDPSILKRAANAAGSPKGRYVIEVGPGPGGLTRAILNEGPAKLIVVETDPRFSEALLDWPEAKSGQMVVIAKDARKVRWEKALEEAGATGPAMIIANLPYNVGTPLLVDWLKAGDWRGEMALMFQKEVAERICAKPDTDAYGRLAVLTHAVTRPYISFTLPPGAFRPPPKVDSGPTLTLPKMGRGQLHFVGASSAQNATGPLPLVGRARVGRGKSKRRLTPTSPPTPPQQNQPATKYFRHQRHTLRTGCIIRPLPQTPPPPEHPRPLREQVIKSENL
jgi:16S rRNA (adenine1518-N6/adenine1519-N6)-dimethyltransferase